MSFVHAVWAAITWRRLRATLGLGLAVGLLRSIGYWETNAALGTMVGPFVVMPLCAFYLMVATLSADEAVSRGARGGRAYYVAFVAATVVSAATVLWYGRIWGALPQEMPLRAELMFMAQVALDIGFIGGLAMLAYVNRRIANQILQGVHNAELRRVQLERKLIESRLATAAAQVDPQLLFGALGQVRDGFERAAPDADKKLEDLIQHLRSALARTVVAGEPDAFKP